MRLQLRARIRNDLEQQSAALLGASGLLINIYLSVLWFSGHGIGQRPLLIFGVLLTITGVQFASFGLLGEFLTYQSQKQGYLDTLPVRARIGF